MSKLTKKEMIMGIGSLLAIISAFLPWYSVSVYGMRTSVNGLTGWWTLSFIAALVLLASVVPQVKQAVPQIEKNRKIIQIVLAAIVALIPFMAIFSTPAEMMGMGSLGIGLFGALAGGIVALVGSITQKKELATETSQQPEQPQEPQQPVNPE